MFKMHQKYKRLKEKLNTEKINLQIERKKWQAKFEVIEKELSEEKEKRRSYRLQVMKRSSRQQLILTKSKEDAQKQLGEERLNSLHQLAAIKSSEAELYNHIDLIESANFNLSLELRKAKNVSTAIFLSKNSVYYLCSSSCVLFLFR